MKLKTLLSATALSGVLLLQSAYAQAQEQTAPQDTSSTGQTDQTDEAIIVTGSRIATQPGLSSPVPITSVPGDLLSQTARISAGDVLNDLPALNSTFSQQNSTRFLGTTGLNLLDLRGLGTQRTLVLVNGRRHVGADILNNAVSPDVNTFPTDLIDRVEVVTGGNSAVYGSDAIAGVVNFVLKDHFEGLQFRGQGGISQYGDAGSYYASLLAGKNFADGRGNIAINLEYARQNDFYASYRDYLKYASAFVTTDTDAAGIASGQSLPGFDGVPDGVFMNDVRPVTISNNGTVLFYARNGALQGKCGRDGNNNGAAANAFFDCPYIFNSAGQLVPQTGTRVGISPNGSMLGGNGDTLREGKLVQILPQLDRYSANLIGHFEVSPAFVPFVEAKYVRTDSVGSGGSGPAFFQGGTIDGFFERPRLDNPFLSTQAHDLLTSNYLAIAQSGYDPNTGSKFATAAAQTAAINAINAGSYRFLLRRNLLDLGVRTEEARRETYRIVGGVRGNFMDTWNYEVSVNYGEFDESTKVLGNLNVQRFLLAMDAKKNASGQIVCGSQLDGGAAYTSVIGGDIAGNDAQLAKDIAACSPLNPFGLGNISDAAKKYVLTDTVSVGKISQFDVSAYLSGDSGKWFSLPGGPIGFALGAEYRRETNFFREDPLVSAGYTFYNAITEFDPPAFEVKEAYGELRLPILKDTPFFQSLELGAAGRVSDYKGSTGTVFAYNFNGVWAPVKDLRFRANYARAVRAPNLSELYSPQSQNFAPGFADPCSARNIGTGTQYREANCKAAGRPDNFDYVYASSLETVSGGNPNLTEETSDSWTYGVILEPHWVPGLSLSVDYYDIKVDNVIASVAAQTIANLCYDSPSLNNPFCGQFQRAGASGGPNGEEPFRIIEGSLLESSVNFAGLRTRGLDTELDYRHRFGGLTLNTKLIWTHYFENTQFTNPTDPNFGNRLLDEVGFPKDAFNVTVDGKLGPVSVNTQFRYIGPQLTTTYENVFEFQGRAPQNADALNDLWYPAVVYVDLRLGVDVTSKSSFYMGVDNLTNRLPPLNSTAIGAGTGIFEPVGRRFYAGFKAGF